MTTGSYDEGPPEVPPPAETRREVRKHECPGRTCGLQVSDQLFCCAGHWYELSAQVRRAIGATASMGLLSAPRQEAVAAALREWEGA